MKAFLIVTAILFHSSHVFASKPKLVLAAEVYPNYAYKNGTGIYLEVAKKVLGDDYDLSFKFGPWARLEKLLLKGKVDGFLVHDPSFLLKAKQQKFVHPQTHLNNTEIYAVFKKGKFKDWNDSYIAKNKVSWLNGFNLQHLFDEKLSYVDVSTDESALKLLLKGRIDVFLTYWETAQKIQNSGFADKSINPDNIVSVATSKSEIETLVLPDNEKSRAILKVWNKNFDKLNKQGVISQIYKNYGEVFLFPHSPLDQFTKDLSLLKGTDMAKQVSGFYKVADYRSETLLELAGESFKGAYQYDEGDGLKKGFFSGNFDPKIGIGTGVICYTNTSKWTGGLNIFFVKKKGYTNLHLVYTDELGDNLWKDDWQHKKSEEKVPASLKELFLKHKDCL